MSQFLSKEGLDRLWTKIGLDQAKQNKDLGDRIDANTNMIFAIHATDSISGGTTVEAGIATTKTITVTGYVATSPETPASYLGIFDGDTMLKEGANTRSINTSSTFTIATYQGTKSFTGKFKFLNGSIVRSNKTTTFTAGLYSYHLVGTTTLPTAAQITAGTKDSLMVKGNYSGSRTFAFTNENTIGWVAVPSGCGCGNGTNTSTFTVPMTLAGTVEITNSGNVKNTYNLYCTPMQSAGTQTIKF